MKALLIAFALLSASQAWSQALNANPFPASPVVIDSPATDSDGKDIKGSWFRVSFDLENTSIEDMQIISLDLELTGHGVSRLYHFAVDEYLGPNGTWRMGPYYIEGLNTEEGHDFTVNATIQGFSSDGQGQPTARISQKIQFVTQ